MPGSFHPPPDVRQAPALAPVLALALALVVAGCDRRQPVAGAAGSEAAVPASGVTSTEPAAAAATEVSPAERERLLALGYLDYSEEAAADGASGTVRHDPARSYPGFNLTTSRNLRLTELIDARGQVVRSWHQEPSGVWVRAVLRPEGDLLVLGWDNDGSGSRYLLRLSWNNEVVWKRDLPVHHDVAPAPDGRLTVLTLSERSLPALHPDLPIRDNQITLLSQDGEVVEQRSFYDMMSRRARLNLVGAERRAVDGAIDYFHANNARWMDREDLEALSPLYSTRNVLATIRNLDAVVIFDWDRAELVWHWGPGEISGPHDATLLPSGNLLVFDNGVARSPRWSRVIEVNPLTRQIEWEYRAPEPTDFFTLSRGAAQRLPNGNTLITESDAGRAFEVTDRGEVVWEYLNPHLDARGRRATLTRLYRYEGDFVRAIGRRHRARTSG